MPIKSNKLSQFWQEFKRRRLVYVITVYASASFVIIELVGNILNPLNLPENLSTIVIIALSIGFPVVIVLSWIFDVTPEGIEKTKALSEIEQGEKTVVPNSWRMATYMSVFIILGLIVFHVISRNVQSKNLSLYGKSIAVLPFRNDSPDSAHVYFINGTMEAILNNLSEFEDLKTISRSSVEQYRKSLKSIPDIAKEMHVSYVLEGSGHKIGNQVRLTIQLIDINDKQRWSHSFTRDLESEDYFVLQSEIASQVVAEIQVVISPEEEGPVRETHSYDKTALELYQCGYEDLLEFIRHGNFDALERTERLYRRALDFDSSYANAYAGLAIVFAYTGRMDSSLFLLNKALSFDSQLDHAYLNRGVYYYLMGDSGAALEDLDTSLELNPDFVPAYVMKANIFHWLTRDYASAIENYDLAFERNSLATRSETALSRLYWYQADTYWNAGFGALARPFLLKKLILDDDSARYFFGLATTEHVHGNFEVAQKLELKAYEYDTTFLPDLWSYIYTGQQLEAYRWARQWDEHRPMSNIIAKGYIFWNAGEEENAEALFKQYIDDLENKISSPSLPNSAGDFHMSLAPLYAFTGDKEKAYRMLDELIRQHNTYPLEWIVKMKYNPMFDSLREEERFQRIIQIMEDRYQAEHERVREWLEETGRL